ncbi:SUMF1/EgtB/PvdO family nonheme iron enzyme [Myxococcota bacterium]|nr:SUMF1/EgtB/PvdO family nonheme iron enzyme [Myxococcota bacterium]
MAAIHANGAGVRHAIARALATANLAPSDAVFRVKRARVELDRDGDVARAEVSIELEDARPLAARSPQELRGLVNPDGAHKLMAWLPGDPARGVAPYFMDILAVSWSRWLEQQPAASLPTGVDRYCPVVGVDLPAARDFAAAVGKRLPTAEEWSLAWGGRELPWGDAPDPICGRVGRPRYDVLPEGGLHPPTPEGIFDLGAWLWQWLDDGRVAGCGPASEGPARPAPGLWPVGVRLVQDA